jgi:hypothetical protein
MPRVLVCVAGAWGPTPSDREVRGAQKKVPKARGAWVLGTRTGFSQFVQATSEP